MAADYADVLYEQSNGLDDIAGALKAMVAKSGTKVNALLFYCGDDPAKEFAEWVPADRHPRVEKKGGKWVLSIDGEGGVPVRVAVVGDPRTPAIYYAISDCPSKLFKNRFVSLVGRHVSTLSRIVLSSADMVKILDSIAEKDFTVKVKYASTATRRVEGGLDSHMDCINKPHKEFFETLDAGVTMKTIRIECTPEGLAYGAGATGSATLTVARDCRFLAARSADMLFDHVLPQVAEMAASRIGQLRFSASTAERRMPEPLIVNFERDIFADPAQNKDHIAALASMPRSGISVYHANPYLHASLVDYYDGSSYDIWVLVSDKLAIIPQIYASESSMGRLVNHIFEKIGEGKIERYKKGEIRG